MYRNLKFLHMTDFFSTDTVLVSVTNMRYDPVVMVYLVVMVDMWQLKRTSPLSALHTSLHCWAIISSNWNKVNSNMIRPLTNTRSWCKLCLPKFAKLRLHGIFSCIIAAGSNELSVVLTFLDFNVRMFKVCAGYAFKVENIFKAEIKVDKFLWMELWN